MKVFIITASIIMGSNLGFARSGDVVRPYEIMQQEKMLDQGQRDPSSQEKFKEKAEKKTENSQATEM